MDVSAPACDFVRYRSLSQTVAGNTLHSQCVRIVSKLLQTWALGYIGCDFIRSAANMLLF